ncbi:MAG: aspartate carbamoyltransferase regulatory subunit [Candidatus Thermoplasmatota archaeon]|nr:aspartate carbamoyltransferase regulatory subunit [Candidatus Thermoplasmatota archaeon]
MREVKIEAIRNGTVIDHITAGTALKVLSILEVDPEATISLAMNVSSGKYGKKDILKIENMELNEDDVDRIALIAPQATINIIRDGEKVKKFKVELPDTIKGIVRCMNPGCISNVPNEPVERIFYVIDKKAPILKCRYCGREMSEFLDYIL